MVDNFRKAGLRSLLAHARQSIPTKREAAEFVACYFAALALAVGFTILVGVLSAQAQEHRHPPQDVSLHEKFYSTWYMPDNPTKSCCRSLMGIHTWLFLDLTVWEMAWAASPANLETRRAP